MRSAVSVIWFHPGGGCILELSKKVLLTGG